MANSIISFIGVEENIRPYCTTLSCSCLISTLSLVFNLTGSMILYYYFYLLRHISLSTLL